MGLRVVRPVVLWPFPETRMKSALSGVSKLVVVEENATAQLAQLADRFGIKADKKILRFDGRPFTPDELRSRVTEVI